MATFRTPPIFAFGSSGGKGREPSAKAGAGRPTKAYAEAAEAEQRRDADEFAPIKTARLVMTERISGYRMTETGRKLS